jgi:hypothetical protein
MVSLSADRILNAASLRSTGNTQGTNCDECLVRLLVASLLVSRAHLFVVKPNFGGYPGSGPCQACNDCNGHSTE